MLLRRLGAVLDRGRRTGAAPPEAGEPQPNPTRPKELQRWVLADTARASMPSALIVVYGLEGQDRVEAVERVAAYTGKLGMVPVFVTEASDFELFRRAGLLFEHLPPAATRRSRGLPLDWDLYVLRRFVLLCQKWQPSCVIALGSVAAAQLAQWRDSPVLPESVRGLLANVQGSDDQP